MLNPGECHVSAPGELVAEEERLARIQIKLKNGEKLFSLIKALVEMNRSGFWWGCTVNSNGN